MKRLKFEDGEYYHIYNRGIDKRALFLEQRDYFRFLAGIYHFNDTNFKPDNFDFDYQGLTLVSKLRNELADIVCWCLMPNHYHMVLCERSEGGITKFMRRLGTGYTMYINKKYGRSGHIFQGAFKAKHINKDVYLQHAIRYIHLNPLELYDPNWKEGGLKYNEESKNFVMKYKWSSLNDYLDNSVFPQVLAYTTKEIIHTQKPEQYLDFLWEWTESGIPEHLAFITKV